MSIFGPSPLTPYWIGVLTLAIAGCVAAAFLCKERWEAGFLALSVIPRLKITDRGLVDVSVKARGQHQLLAQLGPGIDDKDVDAKTAGAARAAGT